VTYTCRTETEFGLKPAVSLVRAGIIATVGGSGVVNAEVVIIIIVPGIVIGALVITVFVLVRWVKPGSFSKSISKTFSLRLNWRRNKHPR
jgi:hypothetical protein